MFKKTVTYTDYNGNERTEDFYFNFTQAEVVEMEMTQEGGLEQYIQKIINSKDQGKIILYFKELVLKAYGEKSDDGRRFIKSDEIRDAFVQTPAYNEIFMELATDADAAAAFVTGITPEYEGKADEVAKRMNEINELTSQEAAKLTAPVEGN